MARTDRRTGRGLDGFYALLALAFAMSMFWALATECRKYSSLATRGQATVATVLAYEPTKSRYAKGTTTYRYHILSFDGLVERVELPREEAAGARIPIVYLPDNPEILALGQAGMSPVALMGNEIVWLALFVLLGSGLLVWSLRTLYKLKTRSDAALTGDLG
jgi:hypothetical protein